MGMICYSIISIILLGGFIIKLGYLGQLDRGWILYWDQYGIAAFGLFSQFISTWQAFLIYKVLKGLFAIRSARSDFDLTVFYKFVLLQLIFHSGSHPNTVEASKKEMLVKTPTGELAPTVIVKKEYHSGMKLNENSFTTRHSSTANKLTA
ncbi:hypothetical protein HK103_007290 [Boothiomyces macroporosus]|uniref:Uncharacterized protein n=1 Tax=Boothiomyces macroporosus TaxID=261099 RepID=A0AAD5UC44_9FUNG|nr:hypothetical protein HK103_007290 [Boothiomyces macroporosus]